MAALAEACCPRLLCVPCAGPRPVMREGWGTSRFGTRIDFMFASAGFPWVPTAAQHVQTRSSDHSLVHVELELAAPAPAAEVAEFEGAGAAAVAIRPPQIAGADVLQQSPHVPCPVEFSAVI